MRQTEANAQKMAEKYAIELAKDENGEITAITVGDISYAAVPIGIDGTTMLQVTLADAIENETKNAEKRLNEFKQTAEKENIKVNTIVKIGKPDTEIIEESEKDYDVIIIGSKGLSGIERFFLGSVAERVVRYSKIPVLVVKNKKGEDED
ncbi:UspA domain protein [groundwater metagenome]|uniref:UspA domain protein n=1 Tax=groundwater metagenome TaxID=717931 RepID=A0A098EDN3_9ZZZZ